MLLAADTNRIVTFVSEYLGIDSWKDVLSIVLDVGIIAFLIYWVYKVFKDTRAGALARSIVGLFVLFYLAKLLNLSTVSALINVVLTALPVLIVVLFAPEIRKILENIGSRKLSDMLLDISKGKFRAEDETETETKRVIEEVVTAVMHMSETKTGALIVFERKNKLEGWDEQGTPVDAYITSRIVEQIFVPNTPLHDGAILIRNCRISAAQCVLPLTASTAVNRNLGTRHIAAIGASENADCVVVIVSEETGAVSVAIDGKIKRGFDAISLKSVLLEELLTHSEKAENTEKKTKNKRGGRK